jgi:transcriptional regulator with XRE-family HTH domain
VNAGHLLRTARRVAGLDQRGLAVAARVGSTTVTDIERGASSPTVETLERLLRAAGLELAVDRRLPVADHALHRYLRLSLAERLYLTLGGRSQPSVDRSVPAWTALWELARAGHVELLGTLAVGVWTPAVAEQPQVAVTPHWHLRTPDPSCALDVVLRADPPSPGAVPVSLGTTTVRVQAPAILALGDFASDTRSVLRAAAALLDARGGTDEAGRRVPAHRDVSASGDWARVMHTKAFRPLPVPDRASGRGWRLDGPASLAQWLRDQGYPT